MSKLTDAERTTIFNALTTAARQYEKDAATAYELAMHGLAIKASAGSARRAAATASHRCPPTARQT